MSPRYRLLSLNRAPVGYRILVRWNRRYPEVDRRMPHLTNIETAAEATGLAPEDIEYAEQIGLLAAGREAEGYYSPEQMRTLYGIARLKQLGLSLDDISDLGITEEVLSDVREYLGSRAEVVSQPDISRRCLDTTIHVLEGHAHALAQQISQLDRLRQSLEHRIDVFRRLSDALEERVRRKAA